MKKNGTKYFNRELNWLEFNQRVLDEALNEEVPLLERLKFLSITASNLDEFFMVRVGGLMMIEGVVRLDPSGMAPAVQLEAIRARARQMVQSQYACFSDSLEPGMRGQDLVRVRSEQLTDRHLHYLGRYFEREVFPVVTPMALDPQAAFPILPNLGLNLLARMKPDKGETRPRFAVIPLGNLNRFVLLPSESGYHYLLIEDLITAFTDRIFPGVPVAECLPFRLTRNADLALIEDNAADLLSQMEKVLDERKQSDCVRLEIDAAVSGTSLSFLQKSLSVTDRQTYRIPGPMRLADFMSIALVEGFEQLKVEPWPPQMPVVVDPKVSMFTTIARKDILLVHPYESFDPVVRLVEEAADDPDVLAIKQTLYRVSRNSPIVTALRRAAEKGKYVTALVELKARFDEARNIEWARKLEQAGAQVIYGVKGLKTHSKVCIVVRREPHGIVRYLHFGTGNYNDVTARIYSDISLLTCDDELGSEATSFFNAITGFSQPLPFRKIEAAPLGLREKLLQLVEDEMERCRHGQKTLIMAKMNSLVDPILIDALYRASQAGVRVMLNVRGICCLRPGIKGLSENILVISIVDRFLEHARIFYFRRGGEELTYIASADWMPRNLDKRIELMAPVENPACKRKVIAILETYFQDTVKARRLLSDGSYERVAAAGGKRPVRSQQLLYKRICDEVKQARNLKRTTFEPYLPSEAE